MVQSQAYLHYALARAQAVWLHFRRSNGNSNPPDFQNRFSKRFAGNEPALSFLKNVYDECSTYSHANPFGIVGVTAIDETNVQPTYFDSDSKTGLVDAFWTTVDGHWSIFALMLPIFLEFTSKQMTDGGFVQCFTEVSRLSMEAQAKLGDELRQRVVSTAIQ